MFLPTINNFETDFKECLLESLNKNDTDYDPNSGSIPIGLLLRTIKTYAESDNEYGCPITAYIRIRDQTVRLCSSTRDSLNKIQELDTVLRLVNIYNLLKGSEVQLTVSINNCVVGDMNSYLEEFDPKSKIRKELARPYLGISNTNKIKKDEPAGAYDMHQLVRKEDFDLELEGIRKAFTDVREDIFRLRSVRYSVRENQLNGNSRNVRDGSPYDNFMSPVGCPITPNNQKEDSFNFFKELHGLKFQSVGDFSNSVEESKNRTLFKLSDLKSKETTILMEGICIYLNEKTAEGDVVKCWFNREESVLEITLAKNIATELIMDLAEINVLCKGRNVEFTILV